MHPAAGALTRPGLISPVSPGCKIGTGRNRTAAFSPGAMRTTSYPRRPNQGAVPCRRADLPGGVAPAGHGSYMVTTTLPVAISSSSAAQR